MCLSVFLYLAVDQLYETNEIILNNNNSYWSCCIVGGPSHDATFKKSNSLRQTTNMLGSSLSSTDGFVSLHLVLIASVCPAFSQIVSQMSGF